MSISNESWEYALHQVSELLCNWRSAPPDSEDSDPPIFSEQRLSSFLAAVAALPGILKDLGAYETTDVYLSCTTLCIRKWNSRDSMPLLRINLRNEEDEVTYCISLEVIGPALINGITWRFSAFARVEDFPEVSRVMLKRLLSDDPFGFSKT